MKIKNKFSNHIELDLSRVEFSPNDLKSGIIIPKTLSESLSYETGMHIGDGHLSCYKREDDEIYLVAYSGDLFNEYDFYQIVLIPLLKKLYNKKFSLYKASKNTLQILIRSKAITTFKINSLGLPNRQKIGKIKIPKIIMDSTIEFRKACIKGIFDTDFSLVFRHGKYPKITGEMPSKNKILKNQILEILNEVGIKYTSCSYKRFDKRFNKTFVNYKIDINGKENLKKWIKEIGFQSPKHLVKLNLWKKYGFCKPFLNYNERKKMLSLSSSVGRALAPKKAAKPW